MNLKGVNHDLERISIRLNSQRLQCLSLYANYPVDIKTIKSVRTIFVGKAYIETSAIMKPGANQELFEDQDFEFNIAIDQRVFQPVFYLDEKRSR